jgi:uncharacterized protein (TIGR03118 family)
MLARRRRPTVRLQVEALETRNLLSANVLQTNLVSDLAGVANVQDKNLVNPWGISESTGSPFWISDNNAGVSTLYDGTGQPQPAPPKQPLVVSIPTPGNPTGHDGTPTGTVFNIDGGKTGGFNVTNGTTSASSVFLFATEDGTIVGWNPGVNPVGSDPAKAGTFGTIAVDNSANPTAADGAVYKGLAIAGSGSTTPIFTGDTASNFVLYAANFRSGKIEVYDTNFHQITLSSTAFNDPNLPAGYAPFNVQVLNGQVYVTYALQDDAKHDDVAGEHHGFVDVFNLNGTPGLAKNNMRLVTGGALNSPWGLALAPPSFGPLAGSLMVGNFGNGHINLYNPTTGDSLGQLVDPDGEAIQIDGLWALKVGNGGSGGDANTVYFTAGLDHESHGLFGSLAPVAAGTAEGPEEKQMLQAAIDVFQLAEQQVQMDLSAKPIDRTQLRLDLQTLHTAFVDLIHAEIRFAHDARADAGATSGHGHDNDHDDWGDWRDFA